VSARPAFQAEDAPAFFGQVEVTPPSSHEGAPVGSQFFTAQALATSSQFPDFLLIPLQTLRGGFDLPLRVDPKSQELALPGPPGSVLGGIDFQSQLSPDPLGQARQYPLCRPLTAHLHVAVIRVTAEAQAAPFQFLVQRVKVEVGQQRGQWPALRRAFLAAASPLVRPLSRSGVVTVVVTPRRFGLLLGLCQACF
jgi:hypothetical protein